ncbi:MAG TPA: M1 family metallopeptidase [Kofleriaceae bacterium]|nr:M1 family metallopeptidase [Kofleriaceae bacterium]
MSCKPLALAALALALALIGSCGSPRPPAATPSPVSAAPAPAPSSPPVAGPPAALEPPQPALRLPRNFEPTQYTARLAIDPGRTGFDGSIAIAGTVAARSSVIWLHGHQLKVGKAVAQQGSFEVPLTVTPKGTDLLEVRAARPLEAGAWTLVLDYAGQLDPVNTTGAFRQTLADHSYVFTQFEAIYARRVFPCVDEPDRKVPWKLSFDVPKQLTVVANSPQASEAPVDDKQKRVEFATTKPLPSYLVAFGVGPFDVVDAGATKRGTPVRVIALAKRGAEAAYAAKTSVRVVEAAEDWFGTPYPYEKLDMLAVPITVGFGAMENAGLITYSETLILQDPARPAKERQRRWIGVASHEVAHQWFGNLVTPVFWDDIWLNEGFASWITPKLSAVLEPAWREDQSELDKRNSALGSDALVSARQIRQPIDDTDDILTAFDRITYDKGASVLNMFEHYVGADVFQRGVREYLAQRAWGNATSTDFIAAIAKAAGPKVAAIGGAPDAAAGTRVIADGFTSFLTQPGAPEITATLACSGGGGGGSGKPTVSLAQRRYVPPGAPAPTAAGKPWTLPICVAYDAAGGRAEVCTILDRPTAELALPAAGKACPRWVMPNVAGRGYYRSAYTAAEILALRDEAWPRLSWPERRAVYFDVAQAAARGRMSLAVALSLVPRMLAGNDRFTVGPALGLVGSLERLVPEKLRDKYELYLRQTFGPGAAQAGFLGKDTDTLDIEETRADLIYTVAWNGREPALVAEAVRLAERGWRDLPEPIRGTVLSIAVDARPELFERVLQAVRREPERSRREEMLWALAGVRDRERQKQALGLLIDPKVDIRETMWLLFGWRTPANLAVAQQFYRDHAAAILKRMPTAETTGPLARLSGLFTATCRAEEREAVVDYVKKTFESLPGGPRIVRQNIESMDQCIASKQLLEPEVKAWLEGMRLPKPDKAGTAGKAGAGAGAPAKAEKAAKPAKAGGGGGSGGGAKK